MYFLTQLDESPTCPPPSWVCCHCTAASHINSEQINQSTSCYKSTQHSPPKKSLTICCSFKSTLLMLFHAWTFSHSMMGGVVSSFNYLTWQSRNPRGVILATAQVLKPMKSKEMTLHHQSYCIAAQLFDSHLRHTADRQHRSMIWIVVDHSCSICSPIEYVQHKFHSYFYP